MGVDVVTVVDDVNDVDFLIAVVVVVGDTVVFAVVEVEGDMVVVIVFIDAKDNRDKEVDICVVTDWEVEELLVGSKFECVWDGDVKLFKTLAVVDTDDDVWRLDGWEVDMLFIDVLSVVWFVAPLSMVWFPSTLIDIATLDGLVEDAICSVVDPVVLASVDIFVEDKLWGVLVVTLKSKYLKP